MDMMPKYLVEKRNRLASKTRDTHLDIVYSQGFNACWVELAPVVEALEFYAGAQADGWFEGYEEKLGNRARQALARLEE